MILSEDQILTFLSDGVLVVENALSAVELNECINGLNATLARHHVDVNNLETSGQFLRQLSSTNGSGGVLDIAYYDDWKVHNISCNPNLFSMTKQLWKAAYSPSSPIDTDTSSVYLETRNQCKFHPYGDFDCENGYLYIDRIGYRLPSALAENLGECGVGNNKGNGKKRKSVSIQRSLTPHLDCCPETFFSTEGKKKWRPIQCFVSLVDTTEPNQGGFEAAKGFHLHFAEWAKHRPPSTYLKKGKSNQYDVVEVPAVCVGEYTHIRPKEDAVVMKMIEHISVKAGAAVFWDER
jgi:hypothetical protein